VILESLESLMGGTSITEIEDAFKK
jgi:hypothetical protein